MTWPLFSETSTDMPADLVLFNQTCNDAWAAGWGKVEQTCALAG